MTGTVVIALLALYLLLVEPWLGQRSYRRMQLALEANQPDARLRFYRQWIWQGWALAIVVLIATLGFAGWSSTQMGLRLPYWPHLPTLGGTATADFIKGVMIGVAAAGSGAVLLGLAVAYLRRSNNAPPTSPAHAPTLAGRRDMLRMFPQTRNERITFAALAVTAGVGEEIVWRGFGLTLLLLLLPNLHPALPITLAALAFGLAHLYQGFAGMVYTAAIGAALAALFWASGSLLWPMLLHVLLDLRILLVRNPVHAIQGDTP